MTDEEKKLLGKLGSGVLDGLVGNDLETSGGSRVWTIIQNGIPTRLKEGKGGRFFNGKENESFAGVRHVLQKWVTDPEKLSFLQKFGWLMEDQDVRTYSAKFKIKNSGKK